MKNPLTSLARFFSRSRKLIGESDYLFTTGHSTYAGEIVNQDSAMRVTAVWACVKLVSETLASLPLVLFKEQGEGRQRAKDHSLYWIFRDGPNPYQDIVQFCETMMIHALLRGNAYARIYFDNRGRVSELYIFPPDSITPVVENGQVFYDTTKDGQTFRLKHTNVFHLRGPSLDGLIGMSPIDFAKETVGAAQAMVKHGGGVWKNGARIGGVLTHPGKLTPAGLQNLKSSWNSQSTGPTNSGGTAILENGVKYESITMTFEQSQYIEQRKLSRADIASIFHVPPHMIGDLERATFSNIEQQSLEFVTYTLRPWFVRWEAAIKSRLLNDDERKIYKAEFNADALLRGDFLSRQNGLAIQRQNGIINIDEWRALENRNPLPDNAGQEYLVPMNMHPAGTDPEPQSEPTPTPDAVPNTTGIAPDKTPRGKEILPIVRAELRRIIRKEYLKLSADLKREQKIGRESVIEDFKFELGERLSPIFEVLKSTNSAKISLATYIETYGERAKNAQNLPEIERFDREIDAFMEEVLQ